MLKHFLSISFLIIFASACKTTRLEQGSQVFGAKASAAKVDDCGAAGIAATEQNKEYQLFKNGKLYPDSLGKFAATLSLKAAWLFDNFGVKTPATYIRDRYIAKYPQGDIEAIGSWMMQEGSKNGVIDLGNGRSINLLELANKIESSMIAETKTADKDGKSAIGDEIIKIALNVAEGQINIKSITPDSPESTRASFDMLVLGEIQKGMESSGLIGDANSLKIANTMITGIRTLSLTSSDASLLTKAVSDFSTTMNQLAQNGTSEFSGNEIREFSQRLIADALVASLGSNSEKSIQSTSDNAWVDSERLLANSSTTDNARGILRDALDKSYITAKELGVESRSNKLTPSAQRYDDLVSDSIKRPTELSKSTSNSFEKNLSLTTKMNPVNFKRAASSFRATIAKSQAARALGAKN